MRLRSVVAAFALVGAGCREAATAPYRTTSDPAPSGLAVALKTIPSYEAALPTAASISAAGDSVVTITALGVSGCIDYAAKAGLANGALVITIISSFPPVPRYCTMDAGSATFRAVVRPAPRGSYDVVLRDREQSQAGAPTFDERELARSSVTLR